MPVTVEIDAPRRGGRGRAAARLPAALPTGVLGPLGLWLALVAYAVLPVVAALHLACRRAEEYLRHDGPRVAEGLAWLLGVHAWAMLLTDRLPGPGDPPVRLVVAARGRPTAAGAAARLVTGLPEGALLGAAGLAALPGWLAALARAVATGRPPPPGRLRPWLLRREAAFLARHAALLGP